MFESLNEKEMMSVDGGLFSPSDISLFVIFYSIVYAYELGYKNGYYDTLTQY